MLDRWFSTIKLPLSWRRFHQLPQDPAYRYEYFNKSAWLSPRPESYSARLELGAREEDLPQEVDALQPVGFRGLVDRDWSRLSRVFAGAFQRVQPFASLSDRRRLDAARACLKQTREGGDGPLIGPACHVALGARHGRPVGAILVTLVPPGDLDDLWNLQWPAPPPPECIEQRLGWPHLTWIFVSPRQAGYGVGTALLSYATRGLIELGYTDLISSFLLGNSSSMLWHWRNGFELLPHAGSRRKFRALMRSLDSPDGGSCSS